MWGNDAAVLDFYTFYSMLEVKGNRGIQLTQHLPLTFRYSMAGGFVIMAGVMICLVSAAPPKQTKHNNALAEADGQI